MFNKVRRYVKDPYYSIGYAMIEKCPHLMSDKFYLSVLWKMLMGYELDWDNPKSFTEKLQWLKLYDRKPIYTTMVDKYRAKLWMADRIGEKYIIPTIAVYKSVDEIDLDMLPEQFVLKCNHDAGSVVVCKDKSTFDLDRAKRKLNKGLKNCFYWYAREWPYKNVKRVVFAEEYICEHGKKECRGSDEFGLHDYKFYCFNGEPRVFFVTSNRGSATGLCEDFYDLSGNHLDMRQLGYNNSQVRPKLPIHLDEMISLARQLSQDTCHLRVDFYEVDGRVYLGELTFFDGGGFCPFNEKEYDMQLGAWIKLPNK